MRWMARGELSQKIVHNHAPTGETREQTWVWSSAPRADGLEDQGGSCRPGALVSPDRGLLGYSWQVALSLCPPGFWLGTSLG